jgi:hypothetical protein
MRECTDTLYPGIAEKHLSPEAKAPGFQQRPVETGLFESVLSDVANSRAIDLPTNVLPLRFHLLFFEPAILRLRIRGKHAFYINK